MGIPLSTPPPPVAITPRAMPAGAPPPAQRVADPRTTALTKTVFDVVPGSTIAARQAAERARTVMQAAVRAAAAAKAAVESLAQLTKGDATAADIATHEGVGPDVLEKFSKAADPLLSAFVTS